MSDARSSGLLKGGGIRGFKRRHHVAIGGALAHQIPDIHLSDATAIRRGVWDFDPQWEFEYSQRELLLMAEKILLTDPKPPYEEPVWLPLAQLMMRAKREIYVGNGIPDPAIASGMYWRTHPAGRSARLDPAKRRSKRGSFYKDSGGGAWE